jgi:hypothetical protein
MEALFVRLASAMLLCPKLVFTAKNGVFAVTNPCGEVFSEPKVSWDIAMFPLPGYDQSR